MRRQRRTPSKAVAAIKDGKSDVICDQGQLAKVSKDKDGVIRREVLTREWTDWVDYWAVDFDYESRKEVIKVPVGTGIGGVLPGFEHGQQDIPLDFEERWTGGYIFENEWQSFRTRKTAAWNCSPPNTPTTAPADTSWQSR